jgi:putative DNA primase/helicase
MDNKQKPIIDLNAINVHFEIIGPRETNKYHVTVKKAGEEHPEFNGWLTKEEIIAKAQEWTDQGCTIWVSINDMEEGNDSNEGVTRLCDLFFDIDAKRADKQKPANEEERFEALKRASKLREYIEHKYNARGFIGLSGNGAHLHFPLPCFPLPSEKFRLLINEKVKSFSKRMSKEAGVEVDNTFDLRRVSTLIGTFNQKIKYTPLETRWISDFYYPNNLNETFNIIRTARESNRTLLKAILDEPIEVTTRTPVTIQPDAEFTPEASKKLEELRKKNPKLDALLNRNICIETEPETMKEPCEYKFKSRSEAEESLLVLLTCYGFTKTQIYYIMEHVSQIGKWQERDDSYRELSYNKAVDYCAKHKAQLLAEQQQTTTQSEQFKEITNADFVFDNGHLYEIIKTPLLTIKIGEKKITFVSEGKTFETKLTFDLNRLEKELEKANATPEEIAYLKRVIEEGIEREFIITKLKGDSLPKFASIIADVFLENFHFVTVAETDDILIYENGVYKYGAETFIKKEIESVVPPETITKNLIEEVLGHIQRSTYEKLEKFNANPYILNLKNGLLNIKTFEFTPHSPTFLSTIQIPVEYNPEAKSELWERVIHEDLYEEDIPVLQEAFGYALFPDNRAQKMFIFLGEGSNGKSLILHVLEALVGKQNVTNVSPQTLTTNDFALSELRDKLVNIYADLPSVSLLHTGKLKALVSGDSITADEKYKKPFQLVNRAKFFFSANVLPKVNDETIAFYRRLVIINFPKTFNEAEADPHLFEKLTQPKELSGILKWALEGLKRLIQNNFKFSYSKSVDEIMEIYTKASDPIKAFLEDETVEDPNGWVAKQELYRAYVEYVNSHKLQAPVTQHTFFQSIPKYVKVTTERKNVKGERIRAYVGIRLKNEQEKEDEENETLQFETQ